MLEGHTSIVVDKNNPQIGTNVSVAKAVHVIEKRKITNERHTESIGIYNARTHETGHAPVNSKPTDICGGFDTFAGLKEVRRGEGAHYRWVENRAFRQDL